MYEIVIDSEKFKGKRMLLQHKMVNEVRERRGNVLWYF